MESIASVLPHFRVLTDICSQVHAAVRYLCQHLYSKWFNYGRYYFVIVLPLEMYEFFNL